MANAGSQEEKGMDVLSRIIGVFASPKETFKDLDRRPTWLVPFIIVVIMATVMQLLLHDIGIQDQMARMEASGRLTAEQLETQQGRMAGPTGYIGLVFAPIVMLVVYSVLAGLLLFSGNTIAGGSSTFKKMFSLVTWSSLVGLASMAASTALVISKGTSIGATISPAAFLTAPTAEAPPTVLFRLLSKIDPFTIWQLGLWVVGISVMYKFTVKKSLIVVGSLWAVWIVLSVALGGVFSKFGM
jgi:hypothetical protein